MQLQEKVSGEILQGPQDTMGDRWGMWKVRRGERNSCHEMLPGLRKGQVGPQVDDGGTYSWGENSYHAPGIHHAEETEVHWW